MIPSTTIQTVIREMYLPNAGTLHLYFDDEVAAHRYAYQEGKQVFTSFHNGQRVWSVKIK